MEIFQRIKELIGANRIEEVFDICLNEFSDNSFQSDILSLKGRFKSLQSAFANGITEENRIEENRIRYSLLYFVTEKEKRTNPNLNVKARLNVLEAIKNYYDLQTSERIKANADLQEKVGTKIDSLKKQYDKLERSNKSLSIALMINNLFQIGEFLPSLKDTAEIFIEEEEIEDAEFDDF